MYMAAMVLKQTKMMHDRLEYFFKSFSLIPGGPSEFTSETPVAIHLFYSPPSGFELPA
jgi:hypothetical protein